MIKRACSFLASRKDFIIFSTIKLTVQLLSLITNIFIVRGLSVEGYGVYSLALMLVGLATTFGFSWSSSAIVYYGSKEKAEDGHLNKTFWSRNIILFFSLLIVTGSFIIFKPDIDIYVGLDVSYLILCWIYARIIEDYMSRYFLAVRKQIFSTIMIFTARFTFLLLILCIKLDVKTVILLNIISDISIIFYLLKVDKKDIGKFQFNKVFFKEVLSFSLWQLFGFSGLYIINFGDNAVIKYYMTTEDVGMYNAAYRLFDGIARLSYVISSFYAANISVYVHNDNKVKLRKFFYRERYIIFGLSIFAHILVMLLSRNIILLLYGERYLDAVPILNILLFGSACRYLTVFYMLYYNTNRKYKVQQNINIARSIINILLDILFIRYFGLLGPAIGTSLAIFLTLIYSIYYCEKRIKKLCN